MTQIEARFISNGLYYKELAGTSLEDKPTTGIAIGSLFHEVDTKSLYAYDGSDWVLQMKFSEEE